MFRVAATAADFPSGKAEPTRLGSNPIRRRQRRMRGNLPGPEGLARHFARAQSLYLAVPMDLCAGASAALHGLPVVPPRAAPRALHPLPLLANAAHAKYSDRLLMACNLLGLCWLWPMSATMKAQPRDVAFSDSRPASA